MKHIQLFYVLFLLSVLVSCKKNNNSTTSNSINGNWELRHIEGGFTAPGSKSDYAPGNGNIWKFNLSMYKYYENGLLISSGSYIVIKDKSAVTGTYMDALVLDQNGNNELFFEVKNDKLTLYRGLIAADGTIETYERTK